MLGARQWKSSRSARSCLGTETADGLQISTSPPKPDKFNKILEGAYLKEKPTPATRTLRKAGDIIAEWEADKATENNTNKGEVK